MKFFIGAMVFGVLYTPLALATTVNKSFPNLEVQGVEKGVLSPKTVKGKVTVVNLWATWCEACKVELKEMETEFKELESDKRFQFAMVTLDKDPEKAKTWITENLKDPEKALKQLYKDPDFTFAEQFAGDTFPVTLIVDQSGKVIKIHEGYDEKSGQTAEIVGDVKKLLATSVQ